MIPPPVLPDLTRVITDFMDWIHHHLFSYFSILKGKMLLKGAILSKYPIFMGLKLYPEFEYLKFKKDRITLKSQNP